MRRLTLRPLLHEDRPGPRLVPADADRRRQRVIGWKRGEQPLAIEGLAHDVRPCAVAGDKSDAEAAGLDRGNDKGFSGAVADEKSSRRESAASSSRLTGLIAWPRFEVAPLASGIKHLRHPDLGEIRMRFVVLQVADNVDQKLVTFQLSDEDRLRVATLVQSPKELPGTSASPRRRAPTRRRCAAVRP